MKPPRFSSQAEADLSSIVAYTFASWGEKQAAQYYDELDDCFSMIAANPQVGRECGYIRPGLRRFESAKHVVFYRAQPDGGMLISRILHQARLPERRDFEEDEV